MANDTVSPKHIVQSVGNPDASFEIPNLLAAGLEQLTNKQRQQKKLAKML